MSTRKETVDYIIDQLGDLVVSSRSMFGPDTMAPAYSGSKLYYAVPGDRLEYREWFQEMVQRTADILPAPLPKEPKNPKN